MRLPRMTTRRWMTVVGFVALLLFLRPYALRAPAHWRLCRYMAGNHAQREAVSLRCLAEAEADLRSREEAKSFDRFWAVLTEDVPSYRRQADYHRHMRRHWYLVSYQTWLSLQAELAADIAQQPADVIWRTIRYGFPAGLDEPDY